MTGKNIKIDEEIAKKQKELNRDLDKVLNFIESLDNLDVDNINIEKLEKSLGILKKSIYKKYKPIVDKKNLDSKK